jgi:hypothetical protein
LLTAMVACEKEITINFGNSEMIDYSPNCSDILHSRIRSLWPGAGGTTSGYNAMSRSINGAKGLVRCGISLFLDVLCTLPQYVLLNSTCGPTIQVRISSSPNTNSIISHILSHRIPIPLFFLPPSFCLSYSSIHIDSFVVISFSVNMT